MLLSLLHQLPAAVPQVRHFNLLLAKINLGIFFFFLLCQSGGGKVGGVFSLETKTEDVSVAAINT